MTDNTIDYTVEGFVMPIVRKGARGYASVNSVLYPDEDGLDVSGAYFVYLLHPIKGSTHFTLEPTPSNVLHYTLEGGDIWLDRDIVKEIVDQIISRKNKTVKEKPKELKKTK